jgi:hypothetical protein
MDTHGRDRSTLLILSRIDVETVATYHLAKPITVEVVNGPGLGQRVITTNALRVHRRGGLNVFLLAWVACLDEGLSRGDWKRMPITTQEVMLREIDRLTEGAGAGDSSAPPRRGRRFR